MTDITKSIDRASNSHAINYITIRTSKGARYSIAPTLQKLTIYEDIYEGGITGTIWFKDDHDLVSNIPIIGNEFIDISISTRDKTGKYLDPYVKTFSIKEVLGNTRDQQSLQHHVVLEFCNTAYITQANIRLNRSFKGSPTEIAQSALATIGITDIDAEQSDHSRLLLFHDARPFHIAFQMADEAVSSINNSASFTLFENAKGWNFKSLYTLSQQPISQTITFDINNLGNDFDRHNAVYHHVDYQFDATSMRQQFLGNDAHTHDMENKTIIKHSSDFKSYFAKFPSMNGISFFVEDPTANDAQGYIQYGVNDGPYVSHTDSDTSQRLSRDMSRDMLETHIATVKIPGAIDITAGIVIYFNYLSLDLKDRENIFKAGKHLISRVKHEISLAEMWTTFEMCKDSYMPTQKKLT